MARSVNGFRRRLVGVGVVVVLVGSVVVSGRPVGVGAQSAPPPSVSEGSAGPVAAAVPVGVGSGVVVPGDARSSVSVGANGVRTVRVGVTDGKVRDSDGRLVAADPSLVVRAGRLVPVASGLPVTIGLSMGAGEGSGGLVEVGRAGRLVRFGRPSATAFSPSPTAVAVQAAGAPGSASVQGTVASGTGPAGAVSVDVPAGGLTAAAAAVRAAAVGCSGGVSVAVAVAVSKLACGATGVVSANRVSFVGVFGPGGDLAYDVGVDSVKERIVLKAPPEAGVGVEYRFPLGVEGVVPVVGSDGSVVFMDGGGAAFTIPAGWAWDSAGRHDTTGGGSGPEVGIGSASSKVGFSVEGTGASMVLVVKPDEAWLRDPHRVFPVSIDPTIELGRGSYNAVSNATVSPGAAGTLVNGTFEAGWSGWQFWNGNGTTNVVVDSNSTRAHDGSQYLLTNTSSTDGGSVYQDIAFNTPAGQSVTVSAWVQGYWGATGGTLCAILLWGSPDYGCTNVSVSNTGWVQVETVVESLTAHNYVRVQFYPAANASTVMLDSVAVVVGNMGLLNGSFERSQAGWATTGSGTNMVVYNNGAIAHDGARYLATNASSSGSVYQDVSMFLPPGQPVTVSAWLRSETPTASGTLCAWLLWAPAENTCTPVSATSAGWQRKQVIVQVNNQHSLLRVEFYPTVGGGTMLLDTVSAIRDGVVNGPNDYTPASNLGPVWAGEGVFGSWYGATGYTRLRFENNPALVGATINSATLHTFIRNCDQQPAGGGQSFNQYGNPIHVRRLVSDFDTNPYAVSDDKTSLPAGAVSYADVDVTDYVRQWVADPASNFGVRLDMGTIPGGNYGYCKIGSNSAEFAGDLNKTTYLEVTYNEAPVANKRYHPIPPVRVLDTRASTSNAGYTGARNVTVVGGTSGVPATGVSAVALNVTAGNGAGSTGGFMSLFPAGSNGAGWSAINWQPGQYAMSNHAVIGVGQAGQVTGQITVGQADLIVEIAGYYDDGTTATAPGGLLYTPLPGARVADTRNSGGVITAGATRTVPIAGLGGVPVTGAGAVAINISGLGQGTGGGAGWVSAWAATDPEPSALTNLSLVNNTDQRSGFAIVKLGTDGSIKLKSTMAIHATVDVVGYYSTSTTTGAGFQPLIPSRILDTRNTTPPGPVADRDVVVADASGMAAAIVNVTLTDTTAVGLARVYPTGDTNAFGISHLFNASTSTSNMTIARTSGDGKIHIRIEGAYANVIVDLLGYVATATTTSTPVNNMLLNGSFETPGSGGGAASWLNGTICGDNPNQRTTNRIVQPGTGGADDGTAYLRLTATSNTAAGSVCQNVNKQPASGERYTLTFRARTAPGNTASGRGAIELWELGSTTSDKTLTPLLTTTTWADYAVTKCAVDSLNTTMRAKFYREITVRPPTERTDGIGVSSATGYPIESLA